MQRPFAVLAAILQLLWLTASANAAGATLPQPGFVASGHIVLFGKNIPLPPGPWRVAAAGFGHVIGDDPGPYGTIGSVLLIRPAEGAGQGFVLVRTNAVPVRGGWGPPQECIDDTTLYRSVAEPRDLHNACTFVSVARSGRIASWAGDASVVRVLPPWALIAGFRVSDRNDFIEARYGMVPAARPHAAWFGTWDTLEPMQRDTARRLGEWARQARQAASIALRAPVDQVPPIQPLVMAEETAGTQPVEDITSLRLGLYKLATYRGPVTAFNWVLASLLAGDVYIGASVAAWQSITHSALYFGNEMAWEWPGDAPVMRFVATPSGVRVAHADAVPGPYRGFTLNGKQVPLPPGRWSVLAQDATPGVSAVVLGSADGPALHGLVVVHANPDRTANIFGTASDCSRRDVYFSTIRYDTPVDGFCSYAKPVTPEAAAADDALWSRARARLIEAGVSVPPVLLAVGARARTRENFVDVRYYFPPGVDMSAEWFGVAHVVASPVLLDHVMALQAWADLVQLPLEQGVRGRLPAETAEVPWPWPMAAVRDALVHQAHAPLEALWIEGAIDEAEQQRQLALADAALAERERQRWSLWARSAYKVATYRVLSYFDAVAVSWIITTSPEQSFAYATINAVAQPVMAYVNEIGWAGSGMGRAAASLQPVDFPEIGKDRL